MFRPQLRIVVLWLLGSLEAFAAAPTVKSLTAPSVNYGVTVSLQAAVADADGNLASVVFTLSGPGITGSQSLAPIVVSGATNTATTSWSAPSTGLYTVLATVKDATNATGTASASFDVFAGSTTILPVTVPSGNAWIVEFPGQILTTENDTATNIDVQSGSNVIFWSGGRVTLLPGFHAESGSFFWATVDHDMNGYSDMEESLDSDGDGIPDAWEVDHGLNPLDPTDAAHIVPDGSGLTYLQKYTLSRGVNHTSGGATLNAVIPTVIATQLHLAYGDAAPQNDVSNATGLIVHKPQ